VNAASLADRTHGLTCDDPGTGTGRQQHDPSGTEVTPNLMRNRALNQRDIDHASGRLLLSLADARWNFVGLAIAPTDFSLAITDDHHGGKAKAASALHDGRATLDLDDAIEQVARHRLFALVLLIASLAGATLLSVSGTHTAYPKESDLELETALASGIGEGLDPAVIFGVPTIQPHGRDPRGGCPLGDQLPDHGGRVTVPARRDAVSYRLVSCRSANQGSTAFVVDHLTTEVLQAPMDRQPRPLQIATELIADPQ